MFCDPRPNNNNKCETINGIREYTITSKLKCIISQHAPMSNSNDCDDVCTTKDPSDERVTSNNNVFWVKAAVGLCMCVYFWLVAYRMHKTIKNIFYTITISASGMFHRLQPKTAFPKWPMAFYFTEFETAKMFSADFVVKLLNFTNIFIIRKCNVHVLKYNYIFEQELLSKNAVPKVTTNRTFPNYTKSNRIRIDRIISKTVH